MAKRSVPKRSSSRSSQTNPQTAGNRAGCIKAYVKLLPKADEATSQNNLSLESGRGFIAVPVDAGRVENIANKLKTYGFQVEDKSRVAITITAQPELFEDVFGAKVRTSKQLKSPLAKNQAYRSPSEVSRFIARPSIPAELQPFISDIVFPESTQVHLGEP